jgi:hypothetical protein
MPDTNDTPAAELHVAPDLSAERARDRDAFLAELRLLLHDEARTGTATVHRVAPAVFYTTLFRSVGVREMSGAYYFHGDYVVGDFKITLFSDYFGPHDVKP